MPEKRGRGSRYTPGRTTARDLDPDIPAWEPQPEETHDAYVAFKVYLDSDHRKVREVQDAGHPSALRWSSEWHWLHRAHEFDSYMARLDFEQLARYRRKMNETHRKLAKAAQGKVLTWLQSFDASRMTPGDAARLLEVSVKIERAAAAAEPMPELADLDSPQQRATLESNLDGLDIDMHDLARHLHEKLGVDPR